MMFAHELDWEEAIDSAHKSLEIGELELWELELIRTRVRNVLAQTPALHESEEVVSA